MPQKPKDEDIAFEIAFYNGLIEKNPNFTQVLVALGELYTQAGMYAQGLAVDEKLVQLKPEDPFVLYNLACSYSLMTHVDKSFRALKKAINCGYTNFQFLERDKDLENLRRDRRFQQYFARVKNRKSPVLPE